MLLVAVALAYTYRDQVRAGYRWLADRPPAADSTVGPFVGPGPDGAAPARRALARLEERGGPAYVTLGAADIAALLDEQVAGPGRPLDSLQVALGDGRVRVRGRLDLAVIPRRLLGPFADALARREPLTAGGRVLLVPDAGPVPTRSGAGAAGAGGRGSGRGGGGGGGGGGARVVWGIDELRVRDFPFPRQVIPAIVRQLGVRGAEEARIPIPMPQAVGDIRVRPDGVRLYRVETR